MSLSKKNSKLIHATSFDVQLLANKIKEVMSEIDFCYLLGSSTSGVVDCQSDLDVACWFNVPLSIDLYTKFVDCVQQIIPNVTVDLGVLNTADCVYQFESLKGILLFARDVEQLSGFFSLTCRLYEHQMASYQRQLNYRQNKDEQS